MGTTFTHKDLADALQVSETTIKSYRRKFPECIPVAHQGKPIRFTEDALRVCTRIRDNFALGMSVEEVHARLSQEFAWITSPSPKKSSRHSPDSAPQEISQGMSNMAKSMVSMMQQQKLIAKRMQTIESQLEELGLEGHTFDAVMAAKQASNAQKDAFFTERLNQLDAITSMLGDTVASLSQQLESFMEGSAGDSGQQPNKTIQFPRSSSSHFAQPGAEEVVEPPREFFTYPLVVRTSEGKYISAAARGRGKLSLNDLKAMLVYGFSSPNHFVMRWEQMDDGWQLTLSQPEIGKPVQYVLQLVELVTQNGTKVIEIVQLFDEINNLHPVEICRIVESLTIAL